MNRCTSPLAIALLTTACGAPQATGPSLIPRAVEQRSNAEPVRPTPVATPDAALDAQVRERVQAFDRAANAFERQAQALGPAITRGRGASEGTDAWVAAQLALGELSHARAAVESSVVALEELAIAREADRKPPYPALQTALTDAAARLERVATSDQALRPGA